MKVGEVLRRVFEGFLSDRVGFVNLLKCSDWLRQVVLDKMYN